MTAKYIQEGEILDYTPGAAVANGQVVVVGTMVGVALMAIAANVTGSVGVQGVYELAKLSTDVVAFGANLYWDTANSRLTVTASGNTFAGRAAAPAAAGTTVARVLLNI